MFNNNFLASPTGVLGTKCNLAEEISNSQNIQFLHFILWKDSHFQGHTGCNMFSRLNRKIGDSLFCKVYCSLKQEGLSPIARSLTPCYEEVRTWSHWVSGVPRLKKVPLRFLELPDEDIQKLTKIAGMRRNKLANPKRHASQVSSD